MQWSCHIRSHKNHFFKRLLLRGGPVPKHTRPRGVGGGEHTSRSLRITAGQMLAASNTQLESRKAPQEDSFRRKERARPPLPRWGKTGTPAALRSLGRGS